MLVDYFFNYSDDINETVGGVFFVIDFFLSLSIVILDVLLKAEEFFFFR